MTDPRDEQRDQQAGPSADPQPQVGPEVIQDLDVTGDDTAQIAGGCTGTHQV